jgi:DNA-directed RNA polymerase specialized sigma24 family protein
MPYRSHDYLLSHVLDEEQVEELLSMRKKGITYKEISKHFKVHINTVKNIIYRARNRGLI